MECEYGNAWVSLKNNEMNNSKLKICDKGHEFYKKSDCPICPICENENKPKDGFLSLLSAPARRALINENIVTLENLAAVSEKDILKLHGLGKSSIPILQASLREKGLTFKNSL